MQNSMNIEELNNEIAENYEIFNSLMESQKQWNSLPQIVSLTFKALGQYIYATHEKDKNTSQQLNIMLNNVKEQQAKFNGKFITKRDFQKSVDELRKQIYEKKYEEESPSIDYKFKKEEGLDRTMIEEVKTITLALIQQRISSTQKSRFSNNKIEQSIQDLINQHNQLKQNFTEIKNSYSSKIEEIRGLIDKEKNNLIIHDLDDSLLINNNKKFQEDLKIVKNELSVLSKCIAKKIDKQVFDQELRFLVKSRELKKSDSIIQYNNQIQSIKKMVQQTWSKKLDKKQYMEFKNKISKQITQKIRLQDVEEIIKSYQTQISNKILEIKNQSKKNEKHFQKIIKTEIQKRENSPKKNNNSNISFSEIKTSLNRVQQKINEKLNQGKEAKQNYVSYQMLHDQTSKNWKKFQQDLSIRDIKLCETIQQSKQNLRKEIYKDFKNKFLDYQSKMVTVSQQFVVGKWISLSHQLINGLIPWEVEVANTMKDVYKWTEKSTNILIVPSGIYKIQFGFFSLQQKSYIQILLNGEPIIKFRQDDRKEMNKKHPNGVITGNTIIQNIILPARGRISVLMSKQSAGQAYLSLIRS